MTSSTAAWSGSFTRHGGASARLPSLPACASETESECVQARPILRWSMIFSENRFPLFGIMLYRPGVFSGTGRNRTTIAPNTVSATQHINTGTKTVHGLPVKSHSPPQMVGMMTAQV